MIRLREKGLVRSIGVSNFTADMLERLERETHVVPAVNQVELHPYFPQEELRAYHDEHDIRTESWSPLAKRSELLQEDVITALAAEKGVTPAQVVLRWHVELEAVPIPKSADAARRRENLDVFSFTPPARGGRGDLGALARTPLGRRPRHPRGVLSRSATDGGCRGCPPPVATRVSAAGDRLDRVSDSTKHPSTETSEHSVVPAAEAYTSAEASAHSAHVAGARGPLSKPYRWLSIGMFSIIFLAAFEAMAVTTIMPLVARRPRRRGALRARLRRAARRRHHRHGHRRQLDRPIRPAAVAPHVGGALRRSGSSSPARP